MPLYILIRSNSQTERFGVGDIHHTIRKAVFYTDSTRA